jgi:hypothetical protein
MALVKALLAILPDMVNISIFKCLGLCYCQYLVTIGSSKELALVVKKL